MRIIVYQGGMWISKSEFSNGFNSIKLWYRILSYLMLYRTVVKSMQNFVFVFEVIRRCAELKVLFGHAELVQVLESESLEGELIAVYKNNCLS
jgi:hypothetical protein